MLPGLLFLWVGLVFGATDDILEKARQALDLRRQLLADYSVEARIHFVIDGPMGRRDFDLQETQHVGKDGQFRRDTARRGRPGAPAEGAPPPGGGGNRRLGQFGLQALSQGRDILTQAGFFLQPALKGKASLAGGEAVEIQIKPKLERLQVDKARLWVDPATGMPLKLEMRFGVGPFVGEAQLTLTLEWDADRRLTVPTQMHLAMTLGQMGEQGPGGSSEITTTWSAYQWGRTFPPDFFPAGGEAPAPPPVRRAEKAREAPETDPFEEIRIKAPGVSAESARTGAENPEEVLIEGGAAQRARGGRGLGEAEIVSRLVGGGPGGGGPGGGEGQSFGGGEAVRFAMVGASRANRLQGSVSAAFSGSALDAKPYSLDGAGAGDPSYFSGNLGVSVGGPLGGSGKGPPALGVFSPRPSFFFDYASRRGSRLESRYASVPTLAERSGDFSHTVYPSGPLAGQPVRIFDPLTGAEFAGARIPAGRLDPTALRLLRYYPSPNRDDPVRNYFREETLHQTEDHLNVRVFLPLAATWLISAAYNANGTGAESLGVFPDLDGTRNSRGQNFALSANQTLGSTLIHNVRARWNRNRQRNLNAFAFREDVARELGIQNTSEAPIDFGLPTVQFTNYTSLDDGSSAISVNEQTTLADSVMWSKGRHFLRAGVDLTWRRVNALGNPNGAGVETFAGVVTSAYDEGEVVPGTGFDLADFLLGLAEGSRIQYGAASHYLRRKELALYVNDNWRIHSRLTLQWGIRYQFVAPWVEKYDHLANLDISPDFRAVQTVTPGEVGPYHGKFPPALIHGDRNNLAPRLSLAWRVFSGKRASILRAGYGIFYPENSYTALANQLIAQPPFGYTVQTSAVNREYLGIRTAFSPSLAAPVPNSYAVDPNFRLPRVENWDLSWQQQLPWRTFLSVGYTGSRGRGLEILTAPNRVTDGQPRIDDASQFLYLTSGARSSYHGLQVLVTRRLSAGISLSAQYQFGKSLDNASSIAGGSRVVVQDNRNLPAEWGRSSFDKRHQLQVKAFWELPFGERRPWVRQRGWANRLLRDWFLSGVLNAASGTPFTAQLLGNQIDNSGTASQQSERADATGDPVTLDPGQRTTGRWFNTAAFGLPTPGTFGDAGRGTINGPGSWVVDLTLTRSIPLPVEGQRLVFSVQATNLLNHANYSGLNTVVNSRGFGQVTAVGAMRQLTINVRYTF